MQQEKNHIQQVIDTVSNTTTSEKTKLEEALVAEKKALETKQQSTTTQESGFLGIFKKTVASATQETPYSITLLNALIGHLDNALKTAVQNATQSDFFDTTWCLLEYLQHPIDNPDQGSAVVKEVNGRRTKLSETLSQTYQTHANQAKDAYENNHLDETSRLAKFKASLNPQERKEEKKVLSWTVKTLPAQEGSTEQQAIIDSYHTLKTIHDAKDTFYQAAELTQSGIALQKQHLEKLDMNKPNNEFLEQKDTEKMEHHVDALAELTQGKNQASSQGKSFTFYELIRDASQKGVLLSNPDDRPQPAEEDKVRAKAALENYLVIKALGSLEATHFQDTATLQSIALFLMQTTLLAQNTALPNPFTTFRDTLKQQADTFLATAKAEVKAKQASPALTERQTALRLQLAQMAVAHYSRAEENQASTAFQIQLEKSEEYFTRKIKPAMDEVGNLNENDLSFWLAYLPNGNRPEAYLITAPENAGINAVFYALAPKKYTENEVRERENKATEPLNQRAETLEKELRLVKDSLGAEKQTNEQIEGLKVTLRTQEAKLTQALAEAETARAEAKTARAEAKKAQDTLQAQLTAARAEAAQDLLTQLTQARAEAKTAEARAEAKTAEAQAEAARAEAAQAPSILTHGFVELLGAMGAAIAYLVLSPEKGKMPPPLQIGIIAASFLALTLINVVLYCRRANSPDNQIAPGQGGGLT